MTEVALALAALLAVAAVLVVARPFLRRAGADEAAEEAPEREQLELIRLVEERDRALAALKELEFDHRTGKVSDEDYERLVGALRREAADALAAIERKDTPA